MKLVVFILTGFGTSSNKLSCYSLATHPEELSKLQEELDLKFGRDSRVNKPDLLPQDYLLNLLCECVRI